MHFLRGSPSPRKKHGQQSTLQMSRSNIEEHVVRRGPKSMCGSLRAWRRAVEKPKIPEVKESFMEHLHVKNCKKPGIYLHIFFSPEASGKINPNRGKEHANHRTSPSALGAQSEHEVLRSDDAQERQHPGSLGTSEAWMRRVTLKGMELFAWPHSMADLRGNKMSPSAPGSSNAPSEVGQAWGYKPR